ncbi:MAG: hypothetical protein NUV69_04565 [Candidatus Curtissbacteria bacterium]|nr:hypothetical protein [Candidatus Curtissbacteria bacterium]
MTKFKKYSEQQFATYLDNLGLYWEYERDWEGKNPDFTIYSDISKKRIVAIAEIKEIDHTKGEKEILKKTNFLSRSGHPNTSERKKIHEVREQFKVVRNYPCLLIIKDLTAPPKPPILTLASMLGDLSISFPVRVPGKKPVGKTFNFFGKQGKMIDQKGNRKQNTTITAIGYIETIKPDVIRSGFDKMMPKIIKEIGGVSDEAHTNLYLEKAQKLENRLTKKGFDLDKTAIGVSFTLNPFRKKRFPRSFFANKYSRIFRYSPSKSRILLDYDWSKV